MATDPLQDDGIAFAALLQELRQKRKTRKAENLPQRARRKVLRRSERTEVLRKTAGRCHICGGIISESDWQADHVFAFSAGGLHAADNYLPAHALCNNYRWDYGSEEFQLILKLGVWTRTQIEKQTAERSASSSSRWSRLSFMRASTAKAALADQPMTCEKRGSFTFLDLPARRCLTAAPVFLCGLAFLGAFAFAKDSDLLSDPRINFGRDPSNATGASSRPYGADADRERKRAKLHPLVDLIGRERCAIANLVEAQQSFAGEPSAEVGKFVIAGHGAAPFRLLAASDEARKFAQHERAVRKYFRACAGVG